MSRRRLRAAAVGALATALITGIAACSSGSSGSSSGSGGKPTITIWNDALAVGSCGVPASQSFLTKGVNLFLKTNPGFNVKISQVACDASPAFNTLLKSSEVAGTTPDIAQLYVGGQVIQNGQYLVPLNSYLPKSYISSLSGWKFVTDGYQAKPNGKIYAVPYGAGYWYMVYYNKKLFAKAGITNPQPATWADLITLAKKLKAKGITPFDIGEKEGYVGAWTQDALISALVGDAGVLKMYTGKQSLDSPTLTQPYTAWHELFADGLTNSDAPSLTYSSGIAEFSAGKAAMTMTGGFFNSAVHEGAGVQRGDLPDPGAAGLAVHQEPVRRPEQLLRRVQELQARGRRHQADQVPDLAAGPGAVGARARAAAQQRLVHRRRPRSRPSSRCSPPSTSTSTWITTRWARRSTTSCRGRSAPTGTRRTRRSSAGRSARPAPRPACRGR